MNLITEIASKASILPPEQQREALTVIEKMLKRQQSQNRNQESERENLPPLKGATAKNGEKSLSLEDFQEARREVWDKFYDEDER